MRLLSVIVEKEIVKEKKKWKMMAGSVLTHTNFRNYYKKLSPEKSVVH